MNLKTIQIIALIEQVAKWYHNTRQWDDESWEPTVSCWNYLTREIDRVLASQSEVPPAMGKDAPVPA